MPEQFMTSKEKQIIGNVIFLHLDPKRLDISSLFKLPFAGSVAKSKRFEEQSHLKSNSPGTIVL